MRILKLSFIISILVIALAAPVLLSGNVLAVDEASKNAACEGLGLVGEDCSEAQAGNDVDSLIAAAVNILSWIVGVAAVIMIIIGGFKYITSNGDSNAVSSAKNTLIYAIIGLAIALLAQALVQFVLKEATAVRSPAPENNASGGIES